MQDIAFLRRPLKRHRARGHSVVYHALQYLELIFFKPDQSAIAATVQFHQVGHAVEGPGHSALAFRATQKIHIQFCKVVSISGEHPDLIFTESRS